VQRPQDPEGTRDRAGPHMKVLVCSYVFAPLVGGIETVSELVAKDLLALGVEVRVVTDTPAASPADDRGLDVLRRPGMRQLMDAFRWADVVLHSNISLRYAPMHLLVRRPALVVHHTWARRQDWSIAWQDRLKRLYCWTAHCYAVSEALAADFANPTGVLANPYDDSAFPYAAGTAAREAGSVLFVGRLGPDKGPEVLLEALALLAARGRRVRCALVGEGSSRAACEAIIASGGLGEHVTLLGKRQRAEALTLMRSSDILVVPSVWQEPFGLVALEGLASGCRVVGSSVGGLPEAIGGCGKLVPARDPAALAEVIAAMVDEPQLGRATPSAVSEHLQSHRRHVVAQRYLDVLRRIAGENR